MFKQFAVKINNKIIQLYKVHVQRDPFSRAANKWFSDKGDETLRLNYQLDKTSIVFDVGGYLGDYAEAIYQKFGCQVYLFEPVPQFYDSCVERFINNPSIICLNYGLSSKSGWFEINLNNNESSFKKPGLSNISQKAEVRSITKVATELGIENIDLIKINIEGAEFELLPEIIDAGLIRRIKYIQVQFHNFDAGAVDARFHIRSMLKQTHREMWNYDFLWESWELL